MKRAVFAVGVLALFLSSAMGASDDAERMAQAREARVVGAKVNLLHWDQTKPDGGWTRWWALDEHAPGFAVDWNKGAKGRPALRLGGAGRKHVFGGWHYSVRRVEPGKYYRLYVDADLKGVPNVRRNVLCRVRWTGKALGNEVSPEYINTYRKGQGYSVTFEQKFIAPEKAESAVVELLVSRAELAEIVFKEISFEVGMPAQPRVVRVASIYWDGSDGGDVAKTLDALSKLIDKAAATRADVICLPETITSISTGLSPKQAAEKLPGDVFFKMSAKAREHGCYIIYGIYEAAEGTVFNTAVIINTDGTLVGKYRKVQLSADEMQLGVAAGDYFKVFDLDFGRVGILISHDAAFAESARALLIDGAEIIFVPAVRENRKVLEARALDNGIWLVASGARTPAVVIDPTGKVATLASLEINDGVAATMINLIEKYRRPHLGDWKNQVIKERRSDAYLKLVQE